MKKLSIILIDSKGSAPASDAPPHSHRYLPGDCIAGHLAFNLSSSIRYTCVKIRFEGNTVTKVARSIDEMCILSQQVVLLGHPNNATEASLPEGMHSWPFEFTIPSHRIPSSGKYRHATVRYTLTAIVAYNTFLGGMQEVKTSHNVELSDLISSVQDSYTKPVSLQGSSSLYSNTDSSSSQSTTTAPATATVQLDHSAFLPGDPLKVVVDLTCPVVLKRDSGCWIQLLRKDRFQAGSNIREYTQVIQSSKHAILFDNNTRNMRIVSNFEVPNQALPTMNTSRAMAIHYYICVLLDMRSKQGLIMPVSSRTISEKTRSKIVQTPGGFEVMLPVVIATVSDSTYIRRKSPFSQRVANVATEDESQSNGRLDGEAAVAQTLTDRGALAVLEPLSRPPGPAVPASTSSSAPSSPSLSRPSQVPNSRLAKPLPSLPPSGNSPPPLVALQQMLPQASAPPANILVHSDLTEQTPSPATTPISASASITAPATTASRTASTSTYTPPVDYKEEETRVLHRGNPIAPLEYPAEKTNHDMPPPLTIVSPAMYRVQQPTAPLAVELGLGPASPGVIENGEVSLGGSGREETGARNGYFDFHESTGSQQHLQQQLLQQQRQQQNTRRIVDYKHSYDSPPYQAK